MGVKYLSLLIMLIAGTIVSVMNVVQKVETVTGLKRLFIVLIIFYVFGNIVQAIVVKATKPVLKIEADDTLIEDIEEGQE